MQAHEIAEKFDLTVYIIINITFAITTSVLQSLAYFLLNYEIMFRKSSLQLI